MAAPAATRCASSTYRDGADLDPALREIEQLARSAAFTLPASSPTRRDARTGCARVTPNRQWPLAWFALFDPESVVEVEEPKASNAYNVGSLTPSVDRVAFDRAFADIRRHIGEGDTYQVNYTFDLRGRFSGDPFSLFAELAATQRGRYSAYIHTGTHAICSASPELFFARRGRHD